MLCQNTNGQPGPMALPADSRWDDCAGVKHSRQNSMVKQKRLRATAPRQLRATCFARVHLPGEGRHVPAGRVVVTRPAAWRFWLHKLNIIAFSTFALQQTLLQGRRI